VRVYSRIILFLSIFFCFFLRTHLGAQEETYLRSDHDKAIKAVNEGEILPLSEILDKVRNEFLGRVISVNLKDSEKGLFGWVYDIMIIDSNNKVMHLRVDAGTSTILSVHSGGGK